MSMGKKINKGVVLSYACSWTLGVGVQHILVMNPAAVAEWRA